MGGISTSHSAVLTGQKATASSSFDLRSWQGLTEILRVGKESLKDPVSYAEFRNLVLEYAQKGGDAELRKKIDVLVATFRGAQTQKAPVSTVQEKIESQKTTPTEPVSTHTGTSAAKTATGFVVGTRRMQPQFSAQPQKFMPVTVQQTVSDVAPVPKKVEMVVPKVADISKILRVTVPAQTTSKPVFVPDVIEVPVIVPDTAVDHTVVATEMVTKTLDEHKLRIAEIKRKVHEFIGNPAALMSSHNDLGKQYMTALLTALKATGAGDGEGVEIAMQKLEDTFQALVSDAPVAVEKEVTILPVQTTPTAESVHEAEDIQDEVIEKEIAVGPEPVVTTPVVAEVQPDEIITEEVSPDVQHHELISQVKVAVPEEEAIVEVSTVEMNVAHQASQTPASGYPQTKYANKGIAATPIADIKLTAGIDPEQYTIKQTELSQPQITQSLHELLHEWSIFSGSGLFGVGPGGSEHPLYLKLAPLSMGEVLAGRWEGADTKVVKTIKEYVDAWRHEQGIAYTINETFEHYLRRVVQKILKRQTGE